MLRFFVPEALEKIFFQIARQTPTEINWLTFAVLVALFLYLVSRFIRAMGLRLDAYLALSARLNGKELSSFNFALGHMADWLPTLFALIALVVISTETGLALDRLSVLDLPTDVRVSLREFAEGFWR